MFKKRKLSFGFFLYTYNLAVSFNQPNLSSVATWDRNGITFANESIIGVNPKDIFIDTKNSIYVIGGANKQILVWHNNSINPIQIISPNFEDLSSIFVTSNGDIYISIDDEKNNVIRWSSETNTSTIVMNPSSRCFNIFIDINDKLYCSMALKYQVSKIDLNSSSTDAIVVAGMDRAGSDSNHLNNPRGIFVDVNFDLFVADIHNNRIQLFPFGETNAITVAGSRSARPTVDLHKPTGVILDAKKYLFIVDKGNKRIVGEGPYGFRCLIGCYGYGFQSNDPDLVSMSFDSFGNIFVVDTKNIYLADNKNSSIMKFQLTNISSGE
ncbi:unnamed protein product [Adineta ricciae]|uniref:NHL repeat containing protein-like protein n=1 Tax=Adineta ricciae TaxID=249248 RepID=A0A815RAZ8_ADIRI|nr:unnamed protein product [Adineta ricciae]CAF1533738.1 unnamed protein product [Adineta ricciae]